MRDVSFKDFVLAVNAPVFPYAWVNFENVGLLLDLGKNVYGVHVQEKFVQPEFISALLIDHEFVVTSRKKIRVDVLSALPFLLQFLSI
jgi:hypothetical protein